MIVDPSAVTAAKSIAEERDRQNAKWGVQNYTPEWWLAILMEEVGELAQAILETHFDNGTDLGGIDNIRTEAVHSAAVAMALVECIDRGRAAAIMLQRSDKGEG
jgi:NTP pyrophosphatase (non-canonical NTP hydrolase)